MLELEKADVAGNNKPAVAPPAYADIEAAEEPTDFKAGGGTDELAETFDAMSFHATGNNMTPPKGQKPDKKPVTQFPEADARVISISEPDAGLPLVIATVKQMSGNDDVLCRALYGNTFTITGGLAPIYVICNVTPPMDESAMKKAQKKSMARRLLFIVNPFEFDGGDEPYCKPPNASVEAFFKTDEATDALMEILLSVYFNFTIHFEEQGVNMIKDIHKMKFPSGHTITYPEFWDERMTAYKSAGDNVINFLRKGYESKLPPKWRQHSPLFDMHEGKNSLQFIDTETGHSWTSAFLAEGFRMPVDTLFTKYAESLPKTVKSCTKPTFRQAVIDFGFGVTKTSTGDSHYQMQSEQVFGIVQRNDEFEETPDSPFIAAVHRPNKGPNSLYEFILTDSPLVKISSTEAPEEIHLADVSMDADLMKKLAAETAGAEDDPELNEIAGPGGDVAEKVSEC